jgi:hypothetical protein
VKGEKPGLIDTYSRWRGRQQGLQGCRKGGLTKDMTWNAMGLKELELRAGEKKFQGNERQI